MRNFLLAAAFVVAWSSGFVGATLGDRAASPGPLLAWRYLVATVIISIVALRRRAARRELVELTKRELVQQLTLGVLGHAVFLGGVFGAASAGLDAGTSALVCALQPMLVAAAGDVWFGDRLSQKQILGLVIGLAGVALSVGGLGPSGLSTTWMVVASLLGLCAAALLERKWRPRVSVMSSLAIQMSTGAVVFATWAACTSGLRVHVSSDLVVAIVWLVVVSGFGGYASFTTCLRRLGATPTSTLLYLTPAVTMLWAWMMFADAPALSQLGGLAVVLLGVALSATPANGSFLRQRWTTRS